MSKLTVEKLQESRKRWKTKLTRAVNMLAKLDRQERRLLAAPKPKPIVNDSLDVRQQPWAQRNEADEKARTEILAKQAERKQAKAKASAARAKAKRAGDLRKMPPQGKDALNYIAGKE